LRLEGVSQSNDVHGYRLPLIWCQIKNSYHNQNRC